MSKSFKHKEFNNVVFDSDFIDLVTLYKLGFKKSDINDEIIRLKDFVLADITELDDELFTEAYIAFNKWRKDVKNILHTPVGNYKHKKRPNTNLVPMYNSGKLLKSFTVNLKRDRKNIWDYKLTVRFKSNHANFTNLNITRVGQNKRKVNWYGWVDELFIGRGIGSIPSARQLMKSIFR